MTHKHYVVLTDFSGPEETFKVVCLTHDISSKLKRSEAEALANAMNLQSCHEQVGFGSDE